MKSETVKGFRDYTGEEAQKRTKIKKIIEETFRVYGFEPAEAPIIEYEEFVKSGNEGDEAVSDIFKLQDKGKRKLALRYEFTFQLKRLAKNKKLPYKRYQIGLVFRDEPVSTNRFRQFTQCDPDIIGSTTKEEAEILALSARILQRLGIKFEINVNNRKLLNEILDKEKIKEKDKEKIIREIDKLDKLPEKTVRQNLKEYKADKILIIFKKPESFFARYKAYSDIQELKKYCQMYGTKINFQPSLARGLSYYNGSVFEIKTAGIKETIAGGGSYLINEIQSTGISFGIERLSQLAKIQVEKTKLLVISLGKDKEAIKLIENLREKNIACIIMFNKISKALEYANSQGIEYVIFLGESEVKKKKVKLRNMQSGKESMLSESELIKKLI